MPDAESRLTTELARERERRERTEAAYEELHGSINAYIDEMEFSDDALNRRLRGGQQQALAILTTHQEPTP